MTGSKEPAIDTASNSTIEADEDIAKLTPNELTVKLHERVKKQIPLTIDGKAPQLEQVRAVMNVDLSAADDLWKENAPKNAVSRYSVTIVICLCHDFYSDIVTWM